MAAEVTICDQLPAHRKEHERELAMESERAEHAKVRKKKEQARQKAEAQRQHQLLGGITQQQYKTRTISNVSITPLIHDSCIL